MKILSFFAVVVCIVWVFQSEWFTIFRNGDMDEIRALLKEELIITLIITLALMIIQNLFTLIPIIGIIMVNIVLFGFFYGYLWSLVTSMSGAFLAFVIYRYWFQSFLFSKVNKNLLYKVEQNGFFFVLLLRIIPFVPSSIINIASGVSSIKLAHFLVATLLGNSLYLLLLAFIANGLLTVEVQGYFLVVLLIALVPSLYLYRFLKRKFNMAENQKWKVRGD